MIFFRFLHQNSNLGLIVVVGTTLLNVLSCASKRISNGSNVEYAKEVPNDSSSNFQLFENIKDRQESVRINLDEHSFGRLVSIASDKDHQTYLKRDEKIYYFDSPLNLDQDSFLLRSNGLFLTLKIQKSVGTIVLKVNRMLKKPIKDSVFSNQDHACRLKVLSPNAIVSGQKPILDLADWECEKLDSSPAHPIEVARELIQKEILGQQGMPSKIAIDSVKPYAISRSETWNIPILFGKYRYELALSKRYLPNSTTAFECLIPIPKIEKKAAIEAFFDQLNEKGIRFHLSTLDNDELIYILSESSNPGYARTLKKHMLKSR